MNQFVSFLSEPDINDESFYIEKLKAARISEDFGDFFNYFLDSQVTPKIENIQELINYSIKTNDNKLFMKILSVIPMDADYLYYYKGCLIANENVPDLSPEQYVIFATIIMTHVKSEKQPISKDISPREDIEIYNSLNMCKEQNDLCKILAKVLSYKVLTIKNDQCLSYKEPKTLQGLACCFKNSYIPIPKTVYQLDHFNKMINSYDVKKIGIPSINGAIFSTNLGNVPVIVKIPLQVSGDIDIIKEAAASLCIINEYIDNFPEFAKCYNYCFGIFTCPYFRIKSNNPEQEIKQKLCKPQFQGSLAGKTVNNIYSVYERLPGKTLRELFETEIFNLDRIKKILKQVLYQLIPLQEGPYEFTHYDLHDGNIMINGDDIYIIDYGMASYKIAGVSFPNFLEEWILDGTGEKLTTGVYDIFFLLKSIYIEASNKIKTLNDPELIKQYQEIEKYTEDVADVIIKGLLETEEGELEEIIPNLIFKNVNWLFYGESPLANGNNTNINICKERTYLWIYNTIQSNEELKFDNNGIYNSIYILPQKIKFDLPPPNTFKYPYSSEIFQKYEQQNSLNIEKEKYKSTILYISCEYLSSLIFNQGDTFAFTNIEVKDKKIKNVSKDIIKSLGLEIFPMSF